MNFVGAFNKVKGTRPCEIFADLRFQLWSADTVFITLGTDTWLMFSNEGSTISCRVQVQRVGGRSVA